MGVVYSVKECDEPSDQVTDVDGQVGYICDDERAEGAGQRQVVAGSKWLPAELIECKLGDMWRRALGYVNEAPPDLKRVVCDDGLVSVFSVEVRVPLLDVPFALSLICLGVPLDTGLWVAVHGRQRLGHLPVVCGRAQVDDLCLALDLLNAGNERSTLDTVDVEIIGRSVGGRKKHHPILRAQQEYQETPEKHRIRDISDLKLVETQHRRPVRYLGRQKWYHVNVFIPVLQLELMRPLV